MRWSFLKADEQNFTHAINKIIIKEIYMYIYILNHLKSPTLDIIPSLMKYSVPT